jgi:hypothetical protein
LARLVGIEAATLAFAGRCSINIEPEQPQVFAYYFPTGGEKKKKGYRKIPVTL